MFPRRLPVAKWTLNKRCVWCKSLMISGRSYGSGSGMWLRSSLHGGSHECAAGLKQVTATVAVLSEICSKAIAVIRRWCASILLAVEVWHAFADFGVTCTAPVKVPSSPFVYPSYRSIERTVCAIFSPPSFKVEHFLD